MSHFILRLSEKPFLEKVLHLHFYPKQFTELNLDSQIILFCKTVFFSEFSIPQKAFPPMLMTSTTFFFDVVNNKRQLNKNKTLLYFTATQVIPHTIFNIRNRLLRLSET